jgi:monofunctional glycosyltransferase
VDERADDGERTLSGAGGDAEPVLRALEPLAEVQASERRIEPPAPAEPSVSREPMLPRAAGGGAGAVAALVILTPRETLAEATPLADAEQRQLATPLELAPAEPEAAPEDPAARESRVATLIALVAEDALSDPTPLAVPHLPPVAPANDLAPERSPPREEDTASESAGAMPASARSQPPLVELIPEVVPTPRPRALSPSVAPALRSLHLEPILRREPDTPTIQTIVPRPEPAPSPPPIPTEAIPAPSPSLPLPLPLPSRALPRVDRRHLRLILRLAVALLVAIAVLMLAMLVLYRWVDPPASTLMLGQRLAGTPISQRWVPLERMSPNLSAAVISSEDGHFCRHHGVDWGELKEAIESAGDGIARGGSTISMQVVKNLFLWPSRSYLRKALEIPLAYAIEALWPKRRILEIYLNIAEWGPGIFGAEAAARYHFRKPALLLSQREAALLAVSLPNPFERQAGRPGPGTARLADNLLLRMRAAQPNLACVRARADRG